MLLLMTDEHVTNLSKMAKANMKRKDTKAGRVTFITIQPIQTLSLIFLLKARLQFYYNTLHSGLIL